MLREWVCPVRNPPLPTSVSVPVSDDGDGDAACRSIDQNPDSYLDHLHRVWRRVRTYLGTILTTGPDTCRSPAMRQVKFHRIASESLLGQAEPWHLCSPPLPDASADCDGLNGSRLGSWGRRFD